MFTLEFLSLSVFAMDSGVIGGPLRATIVVILLLTIVAVKFELGDIVPPLPYNTLLDVCFFLTAGGTFLICFFSVIPQYFIGHWMHSAHDDMNTANIVVAAFSFGVVAFSACYYAIVARRIMAENDERFPNVHEVLNGLNYYVFRYYTPVFLHKLDYTDSKENSAKLSESSLYVPIATD
jgi:hypothetical protein